MTPWEVPDPPVGYDDEYARMADPIPPSRLEMARWRIEAAIHNAPSTISRNIAYRLPWRIVYWCVMRAASGALRRNQHPDDLGTMDLLEYAGKKARE